MKIFIKKYLPILLAILYVISPIDLVPDVVPLYGLGDDVMATLLLLIYKYISYKKSNTKRNEVVEGEIVEN